jgi:hypothetical protein
MLIFNRKEMPMRAMALLVAVLLVAGLAAPVAAGPATPSPADLAFVRSLADPQAVPLPEVGTPTPQRKSCSASTDCGDGNTASCAGNSTCQVTTAGVKCDGNEVQCPNFCSIGMSCQCCSGFYSGACFSRQGNCQYTSAGISCNGNEWTCATMCPDCPNYW